MEKVIYFGGPIVTMDVPLHVQALVVEGEEILWAGDLAGARAAAGPGARQVDLKGRALLPAFIDAHSHLAAWAYSLLQIPLGDCAGGEEICERLVARCREEPLPPGAWVRGTGYGQTPMDRGGPPDRWALDRACPEHPVVIQHASGHAGVFNSLALKQLGVGEDSPCPAGGRMERDSSGRLTGRMEENAFLELLNQVPMEGLERLFQALDRAQEGYAARGIVTVQEGLLSQSLVPLYQALLARDRLKLDVVAYVDGAQPQLWETFAPWRGDYRNNFRLGGVKIFLDGSPQARTAWMRRPYAGEESYAGYPTLTDEEVDRRVRLAWELDTQLLAHCNGDGAAEQLLRALERAEKAGKMPRRPVMIHAQLLAPDQLERVRALGVIPSFFVAHVYHWGEDHVKNFGPDRAAHISPAGSALALGIPFTFHQDTPVLPPDMLETVWCAANRLTRTGRVLGAEEAIPVAEGLRAVTSRAAFQYGEEGRKGTLARGKRADLVVLSADPLATDPGKLREIQVLATLKGGKILYQR